MTGATTAEALLGQLHGVPGVTGALLADEDGRCLGASFPAALLDDAGRRALALGLSEAGAAMKHLAAGLDVLELRYASWRLVASRVRGALLVVLCERAANLELLLLYVRAMENRLPAVLRAPPAPGPGSAAPGPGRAAPAAATPAPRPAPRPAPAPSAPRVKAIPTPAPVEAPATPAPGAAAADAPKGREKAEREHLRKVLALCAGNRSAASRMLGLERDALDEKIRRYGLG